MYGSREYQQKKTTEFTVAKMTTIFCLGILTLLLLAKLNLPSDPNYENCIAEYSKLKTNCTVRNMLVGYEGGFPRANEQLDKIHGKYYRTTRMTIIFPVGNQTFEYVLDQHPSSDEKLGEEKTCYWDGINIPELEMPCWHPLDFLLLVGSIISAFLVTVTWGTYLEVHL